MSFLKHHYYEFLRKSSLKLKCFLISNTFVAIKMYANVLQQYISFELNMIETSFKNWYVSYHQLYNMEEGTSKEGVITRMNMVCINKGWSITGLPVSHL